MQINLWGGVNKPGIHYVPIRTDLMTLLSFAGGPTEAAKLSEVVIKRKIASDGADQQLLRVNVEDALSGKSGLNPVLQANDIVMIPVSKPLISQNTLSVIAVTGGILSIVIAGFIIQNQLKK
jgi:protein involved in polysaccharide export with SLBB domain